jgi:hypothetical protein
MTMDLHDFLAERAERLAFLDLTRRDDIVVDRVASTDSGFDFLVTVTRGGARNGRVFGVQSKARDGSVRHPAELGADGDYPAGTDAPFPICVFLYTMSDDRGYYRWIKEPVVGTRGKPVLRSPADPVWRALDGAELGHIIEAVDSWYAAQQQPQAA